MQFSDVFEVDKEVISQYGAIDISLVCDIPLFVDPMLIFNSEKPEYQKLHEKIIKYFSFFRNESSKGINQRRDKSMVLFS